MATHSENELLSQAEMISNFGIWELDIQTNTLTWSDGVFRICGYEPQEFEVTFEKYLSVIHPDDREATIKKIENTKTTGKEFDVREKFITKTGGIIHINSKGKFIKDENGKGIKIRGVFQDITQTVDLETKLNNTVLDLKAQNEFIETILKNLPIGIAVNKIDTGEATVVNDQFAKAYGWSNKDLTDVSAFLEKIYPDETYRKEMTEKIMGDMGSGEAERMYWPSIKVTTSTGDLKTVDAKNIPLFEQNLMISTVVDVTEKTNLESKRSEISANLKALIENTPDIIFSIDLNFNLLTFNAAFENIVKKLALGEIAVGDYIFDLYSADKRELYSAVFLIVKEGKRYVFEDELIIDGQSVFYDVAVNPIQDENNQVIGVSVFSKDVTEKKQKDLEIERIKVNQDYIINGTPDFIWSINTKMELTAANTAFGKMIEESSGVKINIGEYIIMPQYPDDMNKIWLDFYKRGLSGESFTENYVNNTYNAPIYYVMSFLPMYNSNHEIIGLACYSKNVTKEKLDFLELEKKDIELEKIMNSSLDVICTFNKESKFVKVNAACERVWGYKPEELIGKHNSILVHPDDIELTASTSEEIHGGLKALNFENRNIKKDGTIIPMIWSANYDEKEELTYCIAKDASAIKSKDDEIKRTNDILKNAQKLAQIGNYELNLNTKEVFCSDEIYNIYEIDRDENVILSPQYFFSLTHPDDLALLKKFQEKIIETGGVDSILHRIITKNNNLKYVRQVVELVYDEKTNTKWLYGTLRDSTSNILVRNEIEESEKKYKYLFESNPSAMFVYDFNTLNITDCNNEALELYGYTRNEFLKLSVEDIRPKEDIELLHKITESEEAYGQINKRVWRHKKKNGEIIFVDATGHLIDFKSKRSSLVQVTDITEKLKAEKSLIASELKYRTMIDSSMDAVLLTIKNGEIVSCNEAACEIFQMTKDEVIAAGRNGLVDTTDPRLITLLEERERTGRTRGELTFKRKDGTKFPGEITSVVFIDTNGLERTSMIIRDITDQKNAEKQIAESNLRYGYVTKATYDTIWDWDLTTDIIYWGEGLSNIFGYHLDNNVSNIEFWEKNIHPDDLERVLNSINQSIINKDSQLNWIEEYRLLKADGDYAFVQDKGIVIRDITGVATRMVGAIQDITQKKEENLRLKLLESVVTNTKDSVLITEAEPIGEPGPRILYVNEAFTKMTGYTAEEVIGKTPRILQGPKTDKKEIKKLSKALINWEPCEITIINYKKNGEEFYINLCVSPVIDDKGSYTHWIAIERDVTEAVMVQQKLKSSLDERNTILESIDDGFFAIDSNSVVTYWNKKAEILLGAKREEVLEKNLHDMFENPNSMAFHDRYRLAIKENRTVNFEEYSIRTKKWFEVSAFGSEKGLSVYFKDVTKKKEAQKKLLFLNQTLLKQTQELTTSNKELEQFAYVASHDLQEPLRMITSFLSQIEKKYNDVLDDKGKQYIYFAVDGAKRMRQIILDLLEYSRIGKNEENLEEIDLNEVINEIKSLYRKQIEELSAQIETKNMPKILSFKTPIRQVLQNLISNALKYQTKGTSVVIKLGVKDKGDFWQFYVEDNGIGISEEYFQKIFIIFQRLHNKEDYAGTGMGLAICKKIIENLGGEIWVETNKQQGSCFNFTIPKI